MKLLMIAVVAAASGPPVIHEPWTPLPCPMHPAATVELEGCLEQAVVRSDRKIDANVAGIFHLIRENADRASFVAGEQAWLRYRRQSCSAVSSASAGGTARPISYLECEQRLNARHLADLTAAEQTLRRR